MTWAMVWQTVRLGGWLLAMSALGLGVGWLMLAGLVRYVIWRS